MAVRGATARAVSSLSAAPSAHTMMLSFTNAPTGSALSMLFLYESMTADRSCRVFTLKPRTPSPRRAAISQLDALPAAYHMAGWGFTNGFGSTLRGGSDQYFPSYPSYVSCVHIFANSRMTSSQISRVWL